MARTVSAPLAPPLPRVPVTPQQRATTHMIAALLLDYPSEDAFATRLAAARAALSGPGAPPARVAAAITGFLDEAGERGQRAMAEHYVAIFDQRRRCCLYLTYYAVGDTRYRGAAILAFKEALAAGGYELTGGELPDYLPVVLEFSARSGDEIAQALLTSHREGIEVLRAALAGTGSPYAHLAEAVSLTLPEVDPATAQRIRALVAAGPPTETVGVTDQLPFPTTPVRYAPGGPGLAMSTQETRA